MDDKMKKPRPRRYVTEGSDAEETRSKTARPTEDAASQPPQTAQEQTKKQPVRRAVRAPAPGAQSQQPDRAVRPAQSEQSEKKAASQQPDRAVRPAQNEQSEKNAAAEQNRSKQHAVSGSAPRPAQTPRAQSARSVSAAQNDNEKTRLTAAQPKAKLKTPVGKKEPSDGDTGVAGGIFKAIIYMTAVLLVSVVLAYAVILVANDVFAFVKSDEAVEVTIPENASVSDISKILADADVISYPSLFRLYAKLQKESGVDEEGNSVFIPGTYTVSPMKNYMQLLDAFKKQYTRDVVWVTIPEGSTVEDIITILVDEYGISTREKFVSAINDYDYDLDFIKDLDTSDGRYYRLEGYLFPDTYQFYTDSSAETVVYRMLINFRAKLSYIGEDYCSERLRELGMTLDEVVTLASMVEKEVKYAVDYENVASVFHNRLADRATYPRLESDATTVYAIWMETGKRPETLGAEELAFESPYNTRKSNGLPPGAVANPGYEALYCAFYPAKTNYYYFVAGNDGYNLYARTYPAHEKNIAAVRKEAEN